MEERNYHHPYEPYDIQVNLMDAIYRCIEDGKVGIFESPTGTGKSLSLICSSLTWLRHDQTQGSEAIDGKNVTSDTPDWVRDHIRAERKRLALEQRETLKARLQKIREQQSREARRAQNNARYPAGKKQRLDETGRQDATDLSQFELEDYESDDQKSHGAVAHPGNHMSSGNLELLGRLGLLHRPDRVANEDDLRETKIIFSSRTHSQLTQFVQEVRRVQIPSHLDVKAEDKSDHRVQGTRVDDIELARLIPLASRKQLCINAQVSRLGSTTAINERCAELQQTKTPSEQRCKYLPKDDNKSLVDDFRDHALAKIHDIEDLVSLGQKLNICPYYAARAAIRQSEIVTLPYPLLLNKAARQTLDLSLRGHIIIIDEAHNLMDTISNIHSLSISHSQLRNCKLQILAYLQRFRNKLKGKNRVYIAQLVRLIDSLIQALEDCASKRQICGIVRLDQLLSGKGIDQINFHKLTRYLEQSKLARKIEGYTLAEAESQEQGAQHSKSSQSHQQQAKTGNSMPALFYVQAFLDTLNNPAPEGRFFIENDEESGHVIKYLLLDPTHAFEEIAREARAVILAGGTMSPLDSYATTLFPYLRPDQLTTWSCGHIIPSTNIVAFPVARSSNGTKFDFSFRQRSCPVRLQAAGECVLDVVSSVPDGVVIFFPSYAYLDEVVRHWQRLFVDHQSESNSSIWDRLQAQKPIFRESKSPGLSETPDSLLADYSLAVASGTGALLLSVIGGKLSEGINFSDRLGRCIIVIGMPYPHRGSAELEAKLEFIERREFERTKEARKGKLAAEKFYQNICMRAVNQSIGRAIRHRHDYASLVLLDYRYQSPSIVAKLPGWIRASLATLDSWAEIRSRMHSFFERMNATFP